MAITSRPRRVLVIANETVGAEVLRDTLAAHARTNEVVVVAPALNSRLRHWLSDEDRARGAAEARLAGCLAGLARCWSPRDPASRERPAQAAVASTTARSS